MSELARLTEEQLEPLAQVLDLLEMSMTPGDMVDAISAGKNLLRGILAGQVVVGVVIPEQPQAETDKIEGIHEA